MTTTANPEFNYKVAVFTITTKTNTHVGSGSQNYGIIDNLIQRDPLTGFPCIFSSSLKGAIREFFRYYLKEDETWTKEASEKFLLHVFGFDRRDVIENDEPNENDNNIIEVKQKPGKYRFLQADLLSIPVRSDRRLFYRTTCPYLLTNLNNSLSNFKKYLKPEFKAILDSINDQLIGDNKAINFDPRPSVLEDIDIVAVPKSPPANLLSLLEITGDSIAISQDVEFAEIVSDFHLPVIARNNLVDGRSTNLWYEQVLPQETRLWFGILYPSSDEYIDNFKRIIQSNPVQIGANASIGYGFSEIKFADWFI